MNPTSIRTLGALILCVALTGCGDDGETTASTGVNTSTGSTSGSGSGGSGNAGQLQFSAPSLAVAENAGNAVLTVTRTGGSSGAVSVTVTSRNGTATQPADYTAVSTTVTFAAGDTAAKTVNVPIVNDSADESDETLYVALSTPTGGAALGSTSEILVTIVDDDVSPPPAPRAVVSATYKQLRVDWTAASTATSYRVMKSAAVGAAFSQVGADLPATARTTDIPVVVAQEDWAATRYAIAACNQAGCTQSSDLSVAGLSLPLIGYLKASNTTNNNNYGTAVALSADGSTLAVGTPDAGDTATPYSGVVYVYQRSGTQWTESAILKASNAESYDEFGRALAFSADGNTLVIGAPSERSASDNPSDNSIYGAGAAYIFSKVSGAWSQTAYLKAAVTPTNFEQFGTSVAISPDGSVVAVGEPYRTVAAEAYAGSAYVFVRSGSSWTRVGPLNTPAPVQYVNFGSSIALDSQGATLVVGAPYEDVAGVVDAGAAHVYTRSGNTWSYARTVAAQTLQANSYFAGVLSLSSDGSTLAVGAQYEDIPGTTVLFSTGAAYLFGLSSTGATQIARLGPSSLNEYDYFGGSLELSRDGNTLVVGARGDDSSTAGAGGAPTDNSMQESGAAYVFVRNGSTWSQRTYLKATNPRAGMSGFSGSLSVSGDGATVVVADSEEDSASTGFNGDQHSQCGSTSSNCAENSGAIYIY